ncbi:BglG family transcription antiterminator LicT [Streptococcus cuniculi]|uniref:PRD domain-containing protein n=1 Tax=Streptococcus cuniculi TaxID=1432788 RepID=A0A4Y9JCA8_9STRE|nr:PRD domain-containing protein [Streptococcus cuniculi]MBF0777844.1 PRD domain-containing protein [Streptococcus cuniculi]TFU98477.1 PRD domain-containing protein [Streptococcus cuniculi]
MVIEKIYNNNVALAVDQDKEVIVMGKGLGFQKKPGDTVDTSMIERTFTLDDHQQLSEFQSLYAHLPAEEIDVVLAIISHAEKELQQSFDVSLYIALVDHIHYTLERHQQGISLKNPLAWEIRKFYPKEFQLGVDALMFIIEHLGVVLDRDEAASIALHLVNAEKNAGITPQTQTLSRIVSNILEIVRLHFACSIDEDSISYHRFRTHVQYFAQRVVNGLVEGKNDAFLYEQVQKNYPQAFATTQKIRSYIEKQFDFPMSQDEQVYLTIHIQRLGAATLSK